MIGFIVWAIVSCCLTGIGISAFFRKKEVGFWANAKTVPVKDIKSYNYAIGKLFIVYGVIFMVLGLPLLSTQNSPVILLSILGVMLETIVMMAVYTLRIEKKYRKQ